MSSVSLNISQHHSVPSSFLSCYRIRGCQTGMVHRLFIGEERVGGQPVVRYEAMSSLVPQNVTVTILTLHGVELLGCLHSKCSSSLAKLLPLVFQFLSLLLSSWVDSSGSLCLTVSLCSF